MGKTDRVEAGRGRGSGPGVVNKKSGKQASVGGARSGGVGGGNRWFYLTIGAVVIGGIVTLSYLSTRPRGVSAVDTTLAPVPNQGHVIGSDTAPLEVVEFGDFECPGCGSFATLAEPDVRARLVNTGIIRFRFLDFPLSMHPNSWPAHLASWCAGEQGKYWEMHDAIFMTQDRWNTQATRRPDRVLEGLASSVGINMDQYKTCVESQKYVPQIRANVEEGARRGVSGTPTFIIGTKQVARPLPYDEFKKFVDEALAAQTQTKGTKKPK